MERLTIVRIEKPGVRLVSEQRERPRPVLSGASVSG